MDGDGIGDICDPGDDNDTIPDKCDPDQIVDVANGISGNSWKISPIAVLRRNATLVQPISGWAEKWEL
ncbi:hypothetical protein AB833_25200 [Chromatiales bacterium (ex Bugula neritina AB1)]|nr:hypothetical protein AB833_25200 [Chromatiales bacterium (ex Bugula neritina AB1)]